MTLASDQKLNPAGLSPTSRRMLELRETVLVEWERRVRARLKEANVLRHPVFIDTIPVFYDNIVEAVTPDYPRADAVDDTTLAHQHGSERARLTNYDPAMVILEYQVFRWTLLEMLQRYGVALNAEELQTIHASIDSAIREAVSAFTEVIDALREQFIAALTHDLRSPLASASMAAELIVHSTAPEEIRNVAAKILENHERMDNMIQSLLSTMAFQRGENLRLDLSYFDILDVIREVQEQSVTQEQRGQLQVVGGSAHGWWDRHAMKRLIENLVGNALKYGAADTPIRIKADQAHERLVLSVHNEGEPILPEEQEAIFLVFQRTRSARDSRRQGWGVGLPFVRAVAQSHGGSVGVDSAPERGTTFLVDIPLDARPFQHTLTLPI